MLHKLYNLITYIILPVSIFVNAMKLGKMNSVENQTIAYAMGWDTHTTEQTFIMFGLIAVFIALILLKKWWYNH